MSKFIDLLLRGMPMLKTWAHFRCVCMALRRFEPALRVACGFSLILLVMVPNINLRAQSFVNIADQQGLYHSLQSTDKWGSGVCFFDFNNDGWDDMVLTQEFDSISFFLNNAGQFEKIEAPIHVNGRNKQFLWVDFDNDGDYDIALSTRFNNFRLYENIGNFEFVDITTSAGLENVAASNYGISFGDYNNDGFLDLYVCRYGGSMDPPTTQIVNLLFRNNGDGTFTDVTFQAGVSDGNQPSFQAAWIDYDKDGWQDLYVINDRGAWNNSLYRNNGDGTFTNVAQQAGALFAGNDPMTISVADFNHNGWLDIFMTNTGTGTPPNQKLSMLLKNNADGTFTEAANAYGVDFDQLSWGATWIDYNNDTYQDLYVCTGRSSNFFPLLPNHFYFSEEGLYFSDSTSVFLGDHVFSSFAVAKGDIDNNGFADLVVQNIEDANFLLWQNSGNENNFLKVTLQGQVSNRMAIGSWVYVHAGEQTFTHYTLCGENYLSQNSQHHIFGLADINQVDSVVVHYLSGHKDTYYDLVANEHYYFTEGDTYKAVIDTSGPSTFCEGDSLILWAGSHQAYLWNTGDTAEFLVVTAPGSYAVQVWNEYGVSASSDVIQVSVLTADEVSVNVTHVSCAGGGDGEIEVLLGQGDIVDIEWLSGQSEPVISGLTSGIYSFSGFDLSGCPVSGNATVGEPSPLLADAVVSDVSCHGDSTGSAYFQITGGVAPYVVDWNVVDNQNIPAGNYVATITDANGCELSFPYIINEPDPLLLDISVDQIPGTSNYWSAQASISGGVPPYSLVWSTGAVNSLLVDSLIPGSYYVAVQDFNNCTDTAYFSVDGSTGIGSPDSEECLIFPNPANNTVFLKNCFTGTATIRMFDQSGRAVRHATLLTHGQSLNVSELPDGLYFVHILSGASSVVRKVLISR
ncbi:MAG: T9SS C-terminal target domain-containing protein [Cryomorphaceae bacterium]|nr:MAG: T9SS C-terminal target domain-containing protein [Cryomorphaceae bacterium]